VKNVPLLKIGSQPRTFQRTIGEVRLLLLTSPEGCSKHEFVVFVNKIQVQLNNARYIVSFV